jgi:subtilisin-like proprotein convertase family protein
MHFLNINDEFISAWNFPCVLMTLISYSEEIEMQTGTGCRQFNLTQMAGRNFLSFPRCKKARLYRLVFNSVVIIILIMSFAGNSAAGQSEQYLNDKLSQGYTIFNSSDTPKDIPDKGKVTSTLAIRDASKIVDIDVLININHSYCADLDIYLIAPDGTRIELATDVGSSDYGFNYTIFDDDAASGITEGTTPFSGCFRPEGQLYDVCYKNTFGTWTLEVTDKSANEYGQIISWSLIIDRKLYSPVIQAKSAAGGNFLDTVFWNDSGRRYEYKVNASGTIPDIGTLSSKQFIVDCLPIEDVNVIVDINHRYDSELGVFLVSPDNTRIELFSHVGGSLANFNRTILDDEAPVSINNGSAPFRGVFKPKGQLSSLIGKNIFGDWTLDVNDDTEGTSGTLNSWSIIADLTDAAYYTECALDSGFKNLVANSGWTTDKTVTFKNLEPNRQYWYRTKARLLNNWYQTSKDDFKNNTKSGLIITDDGDVKIQLLAECQPEQMFIISNPSFESTGGWSTAKNYSAINIAYVSKSAYWASDGSRSLGIIFPYYVYPGGIYAYVRQSVNWTDIDYLRFDFYCYAIPELNLSMWIGDKKIWAHNPYGYPQSSSNQIDVSDIRAVKDLIMRVDFNVAGNWVFDSDICWDNFRAYGKPYSNPPTSGSMISLPININISNTWKKLIYNATLLPGTNIAVDILSASDQEPISGFENLSSGTDLSGLSEKSIRLRARFNTDNPDIAPVLHDWMLSYTKASGESNWSNVTNSAGGM